MEPASNDVQLTWRHGAGIALREAAKKLRALPPDGKENG